MGFSAGTHDLIYGIYDSADVCICFCLPEISGRSGNGGIFRILLCCGETITLEGKGVLELYSFDGTHPVDMPWYAPSEKVTVENNVEYVVAENKNYAWTKEECDAAKAGFSVTEIVDKANKSHWDRVYSTQMYGYDENGNATACTDADASNYVSTKKGHGFYDMTCTVSNSLPLAAYCNF